MRELRTFYSDKFKIEDNSLFLQDIDLLHHLIDVLRYKEQILFFLIGKGHKFKLKIKQIRKNYIVCDIENSIILPLDKNRVNIFISYIRKRNFEWILTQVSQFSAFNIYVLETQRSKKILQKEKSYKLKRFNRIILNSVETTGFSNISKVYDIIDFVQLDNFLKPKNITLLLDPEGINLSTFISIYDKLMFENLNIIVGPEGGFSSDEIKFFNTKKLYKIKLTAHILKTETALLYFLSVFKYFNFI